MRPRSSNATPISRAPEALGVRPPADGDQHDVGLDPRTARPSTRASRARRRPVRSAARRRGLEPEGDALLLRARVCSCAPICAVHPRHDAVEELDHRHLGAEPAPHRARARARSRRRRSTSRRSGTCGSASASVELTMRSPSNGRLGERRRLAAGRDQDARRLERLLAVAVRARRRGRRAASRAAPGTQSILFFLKSAGDALREAAARPCPCAPSSPAGRASTPLDLDAVHAEPVPRLVIELARVEQRLARDAADVQARAAERRRPSRRTRPACRAARRGSPPT